MKFKIEEIAKKESYRRYTRARGRLTPKGQTFTFCRVVLVRTDPPTHRRRGGGGDVVVSARRKTFREAKAVLQELLSISDAEWRRMESRFDAAQKVERARSRERMRKVEIQRAQFAVREGERAAKVLQKLRAS